MTECSSLAQSPWVYRMPQAPTNPAQTRVESLPSWVPDSERRTPGQIHIREEVKWVFLDLVDVVVLTSVVVVAAAAAAAFVAAVVVVVGKM